MVLWVSVSLTLVASVAFGQLDDEVKVDYSPVGGCDDGVIGAEVDLPIDCRDPSTWPMCPTWTCETAEWDKIGIAAGASATTLDLAPTHEAHGGHKCISANTTDLYPLSGYPNGIPSSGYHRPKWPAYGEYYWVAPLRYVHALEHGAVVFMYHPCAPRALIEQFRNLATGCLWKHLFFGFRGDLEQAWPLAIVSYGHILKINDISEQNIEEIREWIRSKAKIGANDEGGVYGDGSYNLALIHKAEIVTELEDSEICPINNEDPNPQPIDLAAALNPLPEEVVDDHHDREHHEDHNPAPVTEAAMFTVGHDDIAQTEQPTTKVPEFQVEHNREHPDHDVHPVYEDVPATAPGGVVTESPAETVKEVIMTTSPVSAVPEPTDSPAGHIAKVPSLADSITNEPPGDEDYYSEEFLTSTQPAPVTTEKTNPKTKQKSNPSSSTDTKLITTSPRVFEVETTTSLRYVTKVHCKQGCRTGRFY